MPTLKRNPPTTADVFKALRKRWPNMDSIRLEWDRVAGYTIDMVGLGAVCITRRTLVAAHREALR